jgi:hypothetical protein
VDNENTKSKIFYTLLKVKIRLLAEKQLWLSWNLYCLEIMFEPGFVPAKVVDRVHREKHIGMRV